MAKKITQSGPQTYKQLQLQNDPNFHPASQELEDFLVNSRGSANRAFMQEANRVNDAKVQSSIYKNSGGTDNFGSSWFDDDVAVGQGLTDQGNYQLSDTRAENEPWYAKLGAGIGKGISLAGTTFLDGTIGLLAGIGTAVSEGRLSGLWDNEVSNGLREFNDKMETWLPNYRTKEEQERPWYENLGTMNFWADSFLKNMGFTVGAFYSGGMFTKALKGVGLLSSSLGASIAGSLYSAVNEGRIEANNTQHDLENLWGTQLQDSYNKRYNELINSGLNRNDLSKALDSLNASYKQESQGIQDRARQAGLIDLVGNTILLSLDNFSTFGRLYAKGFNNAKGLASGMKRAAAGEATETAGKQFTKEAGKYVFNKTTTKQALLNGARIGLVEGNEELAQQMLSNFSGDYRSYDSPDSYYNALKDQKAEQKTSDFITSLTKSFVDSYGSGEQWEQFAVGALTGLLGMPTFGRVQNSDASTYLGRGKTIGLSGGLFGELSVAKDKNAQGKEAANVMNNFVDKLQSQKRHFVQSQSFTDAMDGWAAEDNAFEYKNAEDNDDFVAISRFAEAGRLDDLKELVSQDFENISDEELEKIANFTSPQGTDSGWKNADGTLMSDTEDGRAEMRSKLAEKRDKILNQVSNYEKALNTVRGIANNSLNSDQLNELAWLSWKVDRFDERFKEVTNEAQSPFKSISAGLHEMKEALKNERFYLTESDKDAEGNSILEQNEKMLKSVENSKNLIDRVLRGDVSSLGILTNPENKKAVEWLSSEDFYNMYNAYNGLKYTDYKKAMESLQDTVKLLEARKTFNDRLTEFSKDPIKVIQNRESIDKKREDVEKVKASVNLKDKIDNSNVSDIVKEAEEEGINLNETLDELNSFFAKKDSKEAKSEDKGETADTADTGTTSSNPTVDEDKKNNDPTVKKVKEAKKIINTANRAKKIAADLKTEDDSINEQTIQDAISLIDASKSVSNSAEELLNTASQAFNDPSNLTMDDPSLANATNEELQEAASNRIDNAKSMVEMIKARIAEDDKELETIPKGAIIITKSVDGISGKDGSEKIPTTNSAKPEPKKEEVVSDAEKMVNSVLPETAPKAIKEQLISDVNSVLQGIDALISKGATNKDIGETITTTDSYNRAIKAYPTLRKEFNDYTLSKRTPPATTSTSAPTATTDSEKVTTPVVSLADIHSASTKQMKSNPNKDESQPKYNYWKPTTTMLPIHHDKGTNTPYYEIAKTLKKNDGSPLYNAQQLRRMEAVHKYLSDHQAFKIVDNGEVHSGDKVQFVIDSALNEAAGELVVLMADKDGRIIGDLMSENDALSKEQYGLLGFIGRVKEEWENSGKPSTFISKETSVVDKNMVGEVPYLADEDEDGVHTLNEVHTINGAITPFKLGIAVSNGQNSRILVEPGRTKNQGQSNLERTVISPLDAKAGQPYLLVPTSNPNRKYMPAPFIMDYYSDRTANSKLGKAIHNVLSRIKDSNNDTIIKVKNDLEELISVKEIHINYEGNEVRVTIKPNNADSQMQIYRGPVDAPNLVEQLERGLHGQPFQISRKYINTTYNGEDYNTMIGELASINLPIGATHTVNEWFTINPLTADGTVGKARSPKTLGYNPNKSDNRVEVSFGATTKMYVNPDTWEVTNDADKVDNYTPEVDLNKIRATAYGIFTKQDMTKPYKTNWGYYDPIGNRFIQEPTIVKRSMGGTLVSKSTATPATPAIVNDFRNSAIMFTGKDYNRKKATKEVAFTTNNKEYHAKFMDNGTIWVIDAAKMGDSAPVALVDKPSADWNSLPVINTSSTPISTISTTPTANPTNIPTAAITSTTPTSDSTTLSAEDRRNKVREAGLLNNNIRKSLWEVLSPEQQQVIVSKLNRPKGKQLMEGLEVAFDMAANSFNESRLGGTIDEFLGRKALHRKEDGHTKVWNEAKERRWMSKVLPQLSTDEHLTVKKGLIRIANSKNPEWAYGQFSEGLITIGSMAASGTLYHEAFHAVANTLLSPQEYEDMFDAAKEKWGDIPEIELEENLAEDFRRYVQLEETPVIGRLVRIYRKLKHLAQKLFGKKIYLNKLFYDINRGKFANRTVGNTNVTRNKETEHSKEMQAILDKAPRNSKGELLAPNGKVSNLTEKQYAQVRTKAFKEWFGDWINVNNITSNINKDGISKVVDENGEPLVVYRAGEIYEDGTIKTRYPGYYFTPIKAIAEQYAKQENVPIRGFFLKANSINYINNGANPIIRSDGKKVAKRGLFEMPWNIEDVNIILEGKEAAYSEGEYLVSNMNQIKLATDNIGTFSKTNDDIRYRKVDVYDLKKQIDKLKRDYNNAHAHINSARSTDRSVIDDIIRKSGISDVLFSYQQNGNGMWSIARISKADFDKKVQDLQDRSVKDYESWLSEDEKLSRQMLEEQESYYRRVEQYHRDKLEYGNLSKDDISYLNERGITSEEYSQMSNLEKQVLLKCKY